MPWPTVLHKYVGNENDDLWETVIERTKSHPEEVGVQGAGYGQTALHAACYRYPPEAAIRVMIDACPQAASAQNSDGETALHLASDGASEQVQMMLLEACPAAVSKVDKYGDSALHLAAHSGATTELLQKMLEASPRTARVMNKRGATPLFLLPRSYEYIQTLEDIEEDGEYEDDWLRVCMFLKATYFGSLEHTNRKFYPLHAAASVMCPRILLQMVARLFPEQAIQRDEEGLTPLAIAASASIFQEPEIEAIDDFQEDQNYDNSTSPIDYAGPNHLDQVNDSTDHIFRIESVSSFGNQSFDHSGENSLISEQQSDSNHGFAKKSSSHPKNSQKLSVIDILVSLNPRAASIPDSEGRLPFARAVESGKLWDEGLRSLLWAAPQALSTRDTKTGMYPFMIAAVEHNASETTIYELIRLLPELVSIGIPSTANAQTTIKTNKSYDKLHDNDKKCDLITSSFSKKRKYDHQSSHHLSDQNKRSSHPIMV